ncbi:MULTISPECIES: purine/pyrimidine permease [Paenibacillus]|uniref:Xanthine permease n=1 Tax=Paenibacillus popilliae TaxID=78057 RepID=A0ABY3AW90_PAEPP|nr:MULTISPECIES: purine/pyrimidine permease [Paenibacillus]TQR47082.1 xanthine permease [Paenibacillus sp. SDF0028]
MKLGLASFQWLVFILAGSLVAPLAVGHAFGFSPQDIAEFMQRTFLIIGISGILQTMFGHRLPIMENPAGLWWGVFAVYGGLIAAGTISLEGGLRQLEMGMLIAGALFIIIAVLRLTSAIGKLFTPLVVGTYLLLLVAQLSGSFMKGMLGVGYRASTHVELQVAIPAIITLLCAMLLPRSSKAFLRNYSVLISLCIGWLLFYLLGITEPIQPSASWVSAPMPFAWGLPELDSGILMTSLFVSLLLIANMMTSIRVMEGVMDNSGKTSEPVNYDRTMLMMGANTGLGGIFSAMGCVPISGTAGFIMTTRIYERLPFVIACVLIAGISFFPPATAFFASIPMPVGYATIFIPFASMVGLGLKEFQSIPMNERNRFILGVSIMMGIGCMFIPAEAVGQLPGLLKTMANNGLIVGMILCMAMEQGSRLLDRGAGRTQKEES